MSRGGARPGAGRKRLKKQPKKFRVHVRLSSELMALMDEARAVEDMLTSRASFLRAALDHYMARLEGGALFRPLDIGRPGISYPLELSHTLKSRADRLLEPRRIGDAEVTDIPSFTALIHEAGRVWGEEIKRRCKVPKEVTAEQARAQRLLSYVKEGMERYPEAADSMQPALAFAEGLVERQAEGEVGEQEINWDAVADRVSRLDGKIERTGTRISDVVRVQAEDVIKRFREGERTRELAEEIAEVAL